LVVAFGGTRPEAIKLAPLAIAARRRLQLDFRIVFSGQQPDMFFATLACFGVKAHQTIEAAGTIESRCPAVMAALARLHIEAIHPDLVLVQGDTNTALACAQAAHDLRTPIGHVEAGLRSGHPARPFPEEQNRRAIGQLASLHFAPCPRARDNLIAEEAPGEIIITGNPVIDALRMFTDRSRPIAQYDILFTCHRRENFGLAAHRIAAEIGQLADTGFRIILPVHTNPGVAEPLTAILGGRDNVDIVRSLSYPSMIDLLRSVRLVISDSGGLQEECAALGTPLLLLREETERPEVVKSGNCRLIGGRPHQLANQALDILRNPDAYRDMRRPAFPYGSGKAADRILDIVTRYLRTAADQGAAFETKLALAR
jgi:UDP-N-acetylglucosamine 2-epimerase (non-hydrolysing)